MKKLEEWEIQYDEHVNWRTGHYLDVVATAKHIACGFMVEMNNTYEEGDYLMQKLIDHDRECNV